MNILHLTLKKKWFDMIASGEKKEEYREIKKYWVTRLYDGCSQKNFDAVIAKNGYSGGAPLISWKHEGITIGKPNPKWCEPDDVDQDVIILKIGELTNGAQRANTIL